MSFPPFRLFYLEQFVEVLHTALLHLLDGDLCLFEVDVLVIKCLEEQTERRTRRRRRERWEESGGVGMGLKSGKYGEREGERDGGDVEGGLLMFYRGSILERTVTQEIISVVNPSLTRCKSGASKPPVCPLGRIKPAFSLNVFFLRERKKGSEGKWEAAAENRSLF